MSQDATGKAFHHINWYSTLLCESVSSPSHTTNNMELQPNPAYGTIGKVTMDDNPAYEPYKH